MTFIGDATTWSIIVMTLESSLTIVNVYNTGHCLHAVGEGHLRIKFRLKIFPSCRHAECRLAECRGTTTNLIYIR
jgi:hypothetical protein